MYFNIYVFYFILFTITFATGTNVTFTGAYYLFLHSALAYDFYNIYTLHFITSLELLHYILYFPACTALFIERFTLKFCALKHRSSTILSCFYIPIDHSRNSLFFAVIAVGNPLELSLAMNHSCLLFVLLLLERRFTLQY